MMQMEINLLLVMLHLDLAEIIWIKMNKNPLSPLQGWKRNRLTPQLVQQFAHGTPYTYV